jgi:hypothetical protein
MILFDGKAITVKQHKEIMEKFHKEVKKPKAGFTLMYSKNQVLADKDNVGFTHKPPSIAIPLIYDHNDKDNIGRQARWCIREIPGRNGSKPRYFPGSIDLKENMLENNEEFLAFLWSFCTIMEDGVATRDNPNANVMIRIEQKGKEATRDIKAKELHAQFQMALYGSSLSDEKMMLLAEAYGVEYDADDFVRDIVVQDLEMVIRKKEQIEKFLDSIKDETITDNIQDRSIIKKSIDSEILFSKEGVWYIDIVGDKSNPKRLKSFENGDGIGEITEYCTKSNPGIIDKLEELLAKKLEDSLA